MSQVLENFLQYQAQLTASLAQDPRVLGLVFVGSAADHARVDQFSDQDFFVIVTPGSAESFRQDLSWLPNRDQILLSPRETAHGLKVLYQDGRVLEFAVFDDQELELAAANDYLVAIDNQDIGPRMAKIQERSIPKPLDEKRELELLLSLLVIGVGRARRGELIAASQHIKSYALEKLLGLIRIWDPAKTSSGDSLNAFRRFENDYPQLGAEIAELLEKSNEDCAKGLLEIVLRHRKDQSVVVTKRLLGWS